MTRFDTWSIPNIYLFFIIQKLFLPLGRNILNVNDEIHPFLFL